MLILTRKVGEKIIVDGDIEFQILNVRGDVISVGITAPKDVIIDREEIHKKRMSGEWKDESK